MNEIYKEYFRDKFEAVLDRFFGKDHKDTTDKYWLLDELLSCFDEEAKE